VARRDGVATRFGADAAVLADPDAEAVGLAATQEERRVFDPALVEEMALWPDHPEVTVAGASASTSHSIGSACRN
jgi:hypothetical protein